MFKFKTRVIPFTNECRYYVIQYKKGLFWKTLTKRVTNYSSLDLWRLDQPVMFPRIETSIEFAKKFQTIEDINKFLKNERDKYAEEYNIRVKQIQERRKSWNS